MKTLTYPIYNLLFTIFILASSTLYADSCSSPNNISVPNTVSDSLKSSNPDKDRFDYYRFTIPADGTAHIYTTDFIGDMDGYLYEDGNQCTWSYIDSDTLPAANIDLTKSVTTETTYVIELYAYSGNSNYILHIDITVPDTVPSIVPTTFSVSENALIGDNVGTVDISGDPDTVTMTGDNGNFTIDTNGVILVNGQLDYETTTSYNLEITATNSEGSTTETITVNIIDEVAPTATDPQIFYIDESAPDGATVGTISADGNPTKYKIISGDPFLVFSLEDNGTITVPDTSLLDQTTTPQYNLDVNISSPEGFVIIQVIINVDSTLPTGDDNTRDFSNVPLFGSDSISINGNIILIGNQLLCKNSNDGDTCQAPTVGVNNNSINQHKARIDTSADAPASNTWAKLTLEDGTGTYAHPDEILFARLYWSARIDDSSITDADKNAARTIQMKGPGSSTYTTFTSSVSRFNWFKSGSVFDYSASQDVTAYVQSHGAGNYSVGGITATNGSNKFASWALIIIVQNPDRDLNNLSIYDGFKAIYNGSGYPSEVTVPASGFLTPVGTEPFQASLFVYTGESEAALDDTAQIQNLAGNWSSLTDGYNDTHDVFNASIYTPEKGFRSDYAGEANPNFKNVVGTDIDKLEINRKADPSKQYLSNSQTSTNIKITSGGDRYTLNMFAFETELHYPKLCYDYSYTQDGFVYTELNDGTQTPNINIPSNSGSPVNISIYIKSLDNDVNFDHISIYSDMNLSEVSYIGSFQRTLINAFGYEGIESEYSSPNCLEVTNDTRQTCKTTAPAGNFRTSIGRPDASGNVGYPLQNSGSMQQDDFMYFKYSVQPESNGPLNTPLNLFSDIQYSLSSGGDLVDPVLGLPFGGSRMPLCPPSTSYTPEWGIFNVIDSNLNASRTGYTGSKYLNNLLTQVVNRPFSADVVALDPITNPPNSPRDINTSVAVELVDIKGFHDVNISCKEPAVKFSERVYLNFTNENKKHIANFYTTFAKQDAAYRIWYIHDGNTSHIITNWSSETDASGALTGINNLYEQIPDADTVCWKSCGSQSPAQTRSAECYECLRTHYGYPLCSRDNFAIRPESYHVSIKDSNLTNSIEIVENNINPGIKLAAGYNYTLDINATNHIDSASTLGYNKQFIKDGNLSYIKLEWMSNGKVCNNILDNSLPVLMSNGTVSGYTFSNDEVGSYKLKVYDSEWTIVDQGVPLHHKNNEYWIYPQPDCDDNSSIRDISGVNPNGYVGCNISSSHKVDRSITLLPPLGYYDLNVSFKPYKLNIDNIIISHGTDLNTIFPLSAPFAYVYMSDMSVENNMSLNAIGTIIAQGKNGITLTNYTQSCYADDLNITLATTLLDGNQDRFMTRLLNIDTTDGSIAGDINSSTTSVTPINIFHDEDNGISTLRIHYNYDRNITDAMNPKELYIKQFNVECLNVADCTLAADQNLNHEVNGTILINKTVDFYYARTYTPRQRFTAATGTAPIYYEIYCDGNGKREILPNGLNSRYNDDPRWFVNTIHTSSLGNATNVSQKAGSYISVVKFPTGNAPDSADLKYTGSNYPYKTTMSITPSSWLIYNKYNPAATTNEFEVEFINNDSSWAGKKSTDTTTKTTGSSTTNRRSMW